MGVTGEIYQGDGVSIFLPQGWQAFPEDVSTSESGVKKLFVYKGAESAFDIFTHAGLTICYYPEGFIYLTGRGFYSDVRDIEPFPLGEYVWGGYVCNSFGYPYTVLEGKKDNRYVQIMILEANGEHRISLYDEDVRRIVESIHIS